MGRSAIGYDVSIKFDANLMLNLTRDINSLSNFKRETPKFFGVADLRYDGLRNWDILELKVVD